MYDRRVVLLFSHPKPQIDYRYVWPHITRQLEDDLGMGKTKKVDLVINGVQRSVSVDSEKVLIDLLREDLHLTGTKQSCDRKGQQMPRHLGDAGGWSSGRGRECPT